MNFKLMNILEIVMVGIIGFVMLIGILTIGGTLENREDDFYWYRNLDRVTYYDGDDLRLYWFDEDGHEEKTLVFDKDEIVRLDNGYQSDGHIWIKIWTD